ncbi:MAG: RNA-guided endonuclease InsQ/TnpB family protein, partial [Leptospirales bacterium]
MKITLKVKLMTTDEQARILLETMEAFNKACDWISERAFESKVFNAYDLHYLLYKEGRDVFCSLPSQLMIRAIAKVSDSYKVDRKRRHFFRDRSAMEYDKRTLSFKDLSWASLATIRGRIKVPLVFGHYAPLDKNRMLGQADLTYSKGKFFLNLVIDVPDDIPFTPTGSLGVDRGIVNLSTDSGGESFSGETVDRVRERSAAHKARLQKNGTKSAKRRLKKVSGREARFKKDTNHVISKRMGSKAKGTCQAIVLEDLKGIRDGITVRHGQRERFGKWAFGQLRSFILYKATMSGVPVLFVDPRTTSRQCSCCGYIDRKNRKSQSEFRCVQ